MVVGSADGGKGGAGGRNCNSTIFKDSTSSITVTIMFNCDTLHTNKHYRRIFLHSLPELTTAVVWGIGGVQAGEWFGGAIINKVSIVQESL